MTVRKLHASERRNLILDSLSKQRIVTVTEMADHCHASEMTIRRDLNYLEQQGLLQRTHGGAMQSHSVNVGAIDFVEPSISQRELTNQSAKKSIAERASTLVAAHQTIALDIGSTMLALADTLRNAQISIFTPSLKIATNMSGSRPRLYLPGGEIRGSEPSLIGLRAIEDLGKFQFDLAFIGVSGICSDGFFDYSLEDTEVKKVMIAQASRSIVLCDSSKFDRRSVARVAGLSDVDLLITDSNPSAALSQALALADVETLVASTDTEE